MKVLQLRQILRSTTALPVRRLAVALLAAAALTACGGGGGNDGGSSQLDSRSPLSEDRDTQTSDPGEQDDTADDPARDTSDNTDEETATDDTDQARADDDDTEGSEPDGGDGSTDTDSGGDEPVTDNTDPAEEETTTDNTDTAEEDSTSDNPDQGDDTTDDSATEETADDETGSDDSLVDAEAQLFQVDGPSFEWERPVERENGDELPISELGGYELRYREEGSQEYQMVLISETDEAVHIEKLESLEGVYEFSVAAYDSEGLYSEFVPIEPEAGYNLP